MYAVAFSIDIQDFQCPLEAATCSCGTHSSGIALLSWLAFVGGLSWLAEFGVTQLTGAPAAIHAVYINLDTANERRTTVEQELMVMGWTYSRLEAIYSPDGRVGCSLSHLRALEQTMAMRVKYAVVVEDDIEFQQPAWFRSQIEAVISSSIPFDVIQFTGRSISLSEMVNDNLGRVSRALSSTGYLVRRGYIPTLLENIRKGAEALQASPNLFPRYAIDVFWSQLQAQDRWLMVLPRTVTQRVSYSSIEKTIVDYSSLLLDDPQVQVPAQRRQLGVSPPVSVHAGDELQGGFLPHAPTSTLHMGGTGWQGYSFQPSEYLNVTHLLSYTSSSSDFSIALFDAAADGKPMALLAHMNLSDVTLQLRPPVILQPGQTYVIAQGSRVGMLTTVRHALVEGCVTESAVMVRYPWIRTWGPSVNASRWSGFSAVDLLDAPPALVRDAPLIGFSFSRVCPNIGNVSLHLNAVSKITSGPQPYPGNVRCSWTISSKHHPSSLVLAVLLLDLGFGDYLMINGHAIDNVGAMKFDEGAAALIEFHATTSGMHIGFDIAAYACGAGWYADFDKDECSPCPAGTFSDTIGAVLQNCLDCPRGTYSMGGSIGCSLCLPGTYGNQSAARSDSFCIPCKQGEYSSSGGVQQCSPCDAGKHSSSTGASMCIDCPAGAFSESSRATACSRCTGSTAAHSSRSSSCLLCAAPMVSKDGLCTGCPAGSFISAIGASYRCVACPRGFFSALPDRTECLSCTWPLGTAIDASSCAPCALGEQLVRSAAYPDLGVCIPCPAGRYGSDSGNGACQLCPAGTYKSGEGGTSVDACRPCPPGTWSDLYGSASDSFCKACPSGKWSSAPGASSQTFCADCAAGTFGNRTGAASVEECTPCPRGTYLSTSGASQIEDCEQCPGGTTTEFVGATFPGDCETCPLGTFSQDGPGGQVCTPCPAGKWSDSALATSEAACNECIPGTYSTLEGGTTAAVCVECPAGTHSGIAGLNSVALCTKCPAGKYSQTMGADSAAYCEPCPSGTYSTTTGNGFVELCRPCLSGTYSTTPGADAASLCVPCGPGKYMLPEIEGADSSASCLACGLGTYQPISVASGEDNCLACSAGKYSGATGAADSSVCTNCPLGKWSAEEGLHSAADCIMCPIGKYGLRAGSPAEDLACAPCPRGRFGTIEGAGSAAQCQVCQAGTYGAEEGGDSPDSCVPCPVGSASEQSGVESCPLCRAGTFTREEGALQCLPCSSGTFAANLGASTCLACETGKYSTVKGSSECLVCPQDRSTKGTGASTVLDCACLADGFAVSDQVEAGGTQCQPCTIRGMACDFGRMPGVRSGFWYEAQQFEIVFPCEPGIACVGGNLFGNISARCALSILVNETLQPPEVACEGRHLTTLAFESPDSLCSAGYRGFRCSQCFDGFYRQNGICRKCPEIRWLLFVLVLSALVLMGGATAVIVRSGVSLAPLTIGVDYFQMLSRILSVRAQWTAPARAALEFARVFEIDLELTAPDCVVQTTFTGMWTAIMLLPLIGVGILITVHSISLGKTLSVWLCTAGRGKRSRRTSEGAVVVEEAFQAQLALPVIAKLHMRRLGAELLLLLQIMYVQLSVRALSAIDCTPLPNGQEALDASPDIVCWQGEHNALAARAVIAIAVYVVGIPITFWAVLRVVESRLRRNLSYQAVNAPGFRLKLVVVDRSGKLKLTERLQYLQSLSGKARDLLAIKQLASGLYERFKFAHMKWILVIMTRKLAITIITVLSSSRPGVQLAAFGAILFVSLMLQLGARPYERLDDGKMELSMERTNQQLQQNFVDHKTSWKDRVRATIQLHSRDAFVDPNIMEETSMVASLAIVLAALVYYTAWAASQEGYPLQASVLRMLDTALVLTVALVSCYMLVLLLYPVFTAIRDYCMKLRRKRVNVQASSEDLDSKPTGESFF